MTLNGGPRRPLRVCMVHYYDFHIDSRLQRQARALADRGHDVDVICLSEPGEIRCARGTIHLRQIRAPKQRGGGALGFVRGYGRFFAGVMRQVSSLDRRLKFDVVSMHTPPDFLTFASLVPKLRGVPLISDVHDPFPELFARIYGLEPKHPLVRLARLEERVSAYPANVLVMVNHEV